MKTKLLIMFVLLMLVSNIALAFKAQTHEYIAQQVCSRFPDCAECDFQVRQGAVYPDAELKDYVNHHVYMTCAPATGATWCAPNASTCEDCSTGTLTDTTAYDKRDEWLAKAKSATGCDKYFNIAVASHYQADTYVIWHKRKGESDNCHSGFEEDIEQNIDDKNYAGWSIDACGENFTASTLGLIVEDMVARSGVDSLEKVGPETNTGISADGWGGKAWGFILKVKSGIQGFIEPYLRGTSLQSYSGIVAGVFTFMIFWIGLRLIFGRRRRRRSRLL